MSFETVVSIVESAVGGVTTTVTPMTQAEYVAFMTPRWIARLQMLQRYGMHGYIEELAASFIGRGAAFQSAMPKWPRRRRRLLRQRQMQQRWQRKEL